MLRFRARMILRDFVRRTWPLVLVFVISGCGAPSEEPVRDDGRSDAEADSLEPMIDAGADAKAEETIAVEDSGSDATDATGAGFPVIAVGAITGATDAELTMIADGVALVNATMKTSCFREYVLSASWTETDGLTQAQIYDKLSSGPITVDVDMYTGSWYENHVTHTVGYEKEAGTVHMNRYYVNTAYMVADNLIHEAEGHSQGFRHDGVKSTSVPYGLNAAFEACAPSKP